MIKNISIKRVVIKTIYQVCGGSLHRLNPELPTSQAFVKILERGSKRPVQLPTHYMYY